jgi:PKHD-type hydroxylase
VSMRHIHQFTWFELFDQKECDDVCKLMSEHPSINGVSSMLSQKPSFRDKLARNCKLAWIPMDQRSSWIYMKLRNQIMHLNERWLNFDLNGEIEALQYLEYGFGQFYGWHTDSGHNEVATRKLTCIIQLSDPSDYVGGKLEVQSQTFTPQGHYVKYAPQRRGTVIVFPSHLLHIARPVWWGRRKALVAWFRGNQPLR